MTPPLAESDYEILLDEDGVPLPWPELPAQNGTTSAADLGDLRYDVTFSGLDELGLSEQFKGLSALWTGRGKPANLAQIRRRTADDRQLIDTLLRSAGHYGGRIESEIIASVRPDEATRVRFEVAPGPLYRFEKILVRAPAESSSNAPVDLAEQLLGIAPGDPILAAQVVALEDRLAERLADAGYPFPTIGPPEIVIDHARRAGELAQRVDAGPQGVFGATRIEGETQGFTKKHMAILARYKPGEPYTGANREDLRQALVQTGLFGAVAVRPVLAGEPKADGTQTVDMVAKVEAAPPRTVSATGGYYTGQGLRLAGSWSHRNLFPPEGSLTGRVVAAQREQLLSGEYRRRNFRSRDQTLSVLASLSTEQQLGYSARTVQLGAGVVRESNLLWQKPMTFSLGVQAIATNQTDRSLLRLLEDGDATFFILAVPGSVTFDNSDDLLNPSSGFRVTARASPEFTLRDGTNFNYVKLQLEGTYYKPVGNSVVVAGRLHMGSIAGATRGRVAPSRRFYAGGGGSVRGFNFQGVGPQDLEGRPTGGNSLTEASIETRYRFKAFGSDLGVAAFVDAGQVYTGTVPSFDSLRVGAGVGVRYYTAFGPVRVDVATPVTRREGDPRIAFYVSIGQAF